MKKAVLLVLVAALLGAACESDSDDSVIGRQPRATPSTADALVIGLVGTMSGPEKWRGEDAFEGADAAVSVLNRSRPEDSPSFDLVTHDDEGDEGRALELVRELAASQQTVGIVYAGPPAALPRAEEVLAAAGIPALLCYGDLYGARLLSAHVFQVPPSLLWEARRIASYVLEDRRYRRIGALVSRSVDGDGAIDALGAALEDQGGRLTSIRRYSPDESIAAHLRGLRDQRVEAVVVQGPPATFNRVFEALGEMGAAYRTSALARAGRRPGARTWRPQIIGFDGAISPRVRGFPRGFVASDTYARGAHYLPVPSLEEFRTAFEEWWDQEPLGWQRRAYEATSLIGWAASRAGGRSRDLASVLERLRGRRFGGLDVTFGPDDHTAVGQTTVGLWVVPRNGIDVPERARLPESMPWVPLARGFSIDGSRTDVLSRDWRYLFRNPPPKAGRAPRNTQLKVGVTTTRSDPVH